MPDDSGASGLDRRSVLVCAGTAPFLALTGQWSEAGTKISQSAVHYQNMPKNGQDCDDCQHFVAPNGCKLVAGTIAPNGWCPLWVRKIA
jgi:hypothetical protein